MHDRDFYDEESLQEYRASLIRQRNELNPVTNQTHIKILDNILEGLPEHYPQADSCPEEPRTTFKEKITNALGGFGVVLYYLVRIIVYILPFVMIGGNFFITFLLITINTFVPFASVVFWIWGLVCAIKGVQDVWAIMYYIAFVVIWIPFFISTITTMFSKNK